MTERSRKYRRRAYWIVFGFCLVNLAWSYIGTWWIGFGGVAHISDAAVASRESGIYSEDGHLIWAVCWSRQPSGPMAAPIRVVTVPWHAAVEAEIGPKYGRASHDIVRQFCRQTEMGHGFSRLDTTAVWQPSLYGPWLQRGVAIPWWMICGIVALYGTARFAREQRRRQLVEAGLCANCGYDLRASPDRCPECGRATPKTMQPRMNPDQRR